MPFLRLASGFGIAWYIFSDAENDTIKKMSEALNKINITDYKSCSNVIVLPEGMNYETYLIKEGYTDVIESVLNRYHDSDDYVAYFIGKMNNQQMKGSSGRTRNYTGDGDGGRNRAMIDILRGRKILYAEAIAQEIVDLGEKDRRIPNKIKELFDKISKIMEEISELRKDIP